MSSSGVLNERDGIRLHSSFPKYDLRVRRRISSRDGVELVQRKEESSRDLRWVWKNHVVRTQELFLRDYLISGNEQEEIAKE